MSQAQGRPCPYLRQIELFQVSLIVFQKFFPFWVAGLIFEALDIKLEAAISFGIQPSEKTLWVK